MDSLFEVVWTGERCYRSCELVRCGGVVVDYKGQFISVRDFILFRNECTRCMGE